MKSTASGQVRLTSEERARISALAIRRSQSLVGTLRVAGACLGAACDAADDDDLSPARGGELVARGAALAAAIPGIAALAATHPEQVTGATLALWEIVDPASAALFAAYRGGAR
mgnify:CR=1 FL=1